MNKREVVEAVLGALREEFGALVRASEEARRGGPAIEATS